MSERLARELMIVCHRVTGDTTRVQYEGSGLWHAYRFTGTEWTLI